MEPPDFIKALLSQSRVVSVVRLPGWSRVCRLPAAAAAGWFSVCFVALHHEEECLLPETHAVSPVTDGSLCREEGGVALTHSVLRVDGGSVVDQVLNTVQVSRPHRHVKRRAVQLDMAERGGQRSESEAEGLIKQQLEALTAHINTVDPYLRSTREQRSILLTSDW